MIPIKINNKKYKIKAIHELSTREFIELEKIKDFDPIKYISWQTGLDLELVYFSKFDERVFVAIGVVPDIIKLKPPKYLLGKKIEDHKIESIGQRFMIETHAQNLQGFNLGLFVAAVALTKSMNIDDINRTVEQLLNASFVEVIPAARFFFRTLKTGRILGRGFLRTLNIFQKMKRLRNAPASIS